MNDLNLRGPSVSLSFARRSSHGTCLRCSFVIPGFTSYQSYLYRRRRSASVFAIIMPVKLGAMPKHTTVIIRSSQLLSATMIEKPGLSKKMMYDFFKHFLKLLCMSERIGMNHCSANIEMTTNQNTTDMQIRPKIEPLLPSAGTQTRK